MGISAPASSWVGVLEGSRIRWRPGYALLIIYQSSDCPAPPQFFSQRLSTVILVYTSTTPIDEFSKELRDILKEFRILSSVSHRNIISIVAILTRRNPSFSRGCAIYTLFIGSPAIEHQIFSLPTGKLARDFFKHTRDALYRDRNEKHRLVSGQLACPCNVRYIVQDVIYKILLSYGTINSERRASSVYRLSVPVQDIGIV